MLTYQNDSQKSERCLEVGNASLIPKLLRNNLRRKLKVANGQETVVVIPVIVPPIEVEVALGTVLVEVRHVAVTIDLANGALYEKRSMPPPTEYFTFQRLYRICDSRSCRSTSRSFSYQLSLFFKIIFSDCPTTLF
jgi:hypothetical protein